MIDYTTQPEGEGIERCPICGNMGKVMRFPPVPGMPVVYYIHRARMMDGMPQPAPQAWCWADDEGKTGAFDFQGGSDA